MFAAIKYTKSFGYQWNQFKKTQFDSYTQTSISENRLRKILGSLWNELPKFDILECGCGPGRFTEVLIQKAQFVLSVDSSDAADVNLEYFPAEKYKNHSVLKSDILGLDHLNHKFDLVLALGLIQHTPNSERTIQNLFQYVKPGGYFVFDHYTFLKSYISMRLIYRQILKRISPQVSLKILNLLSKIFLPLHKAFRNIKFLKMLLNRISPFITYYDIYPELSGKLQKEWALLDTFDSLTDCYKHFKTKPEILNILNTLGAEIIFCEYGGNGVEVVCRKRSQ